MCNPNPGAGIPTLVKRGLETFNLHHGIQSRHQEILPHSGINLFVYLFSISAFCMFHDTCINEHFYKRGM